MTTLEVFEKVREMVLTTKETNREHIDAFKIGYITSNAWGVCDFINMNYELSYNQKEQLKDDFIKHYELKFGYSDNLFLFKTKTERLQFLDLYIEHLKKEEKCTA
jgi:hypothetical protein